MKGSIEKGDGKKAERENLFDLLPEEISNFYIFIAENIHTQIFLWSPYFRKNPGFFLSI